MKYHFVYPQVGMVEPEFELTGPILPECGLTLT